MTRRLSRRPPHLRACHPRSAQGVGVRRLPRRWRAWDSTTGTTIIAHAAKASAGVDRTRAAMRLPVVPISAAAVMGTTIHAPAPARAMTAAATIGAHAPTNPAGDDVRAPTGMRTPQCAATVGRLMAIAVATAPGAVHGRSATTGRPPVAREALHAAPHPLTLAVAIVVPARQARQARPRVVAASGAISHSMRPERDAAASTRVIRARAVACQWRKKRRRRERPHLARR